LISYGGSSLIIMAIAVSILLRIDHECRLDGGSQQDDIAKEEIENDEKE